MTTEHISGAVATYLTGLLAVFAANVQPLVALLGLVLVIVRLIYEVPKAVTAMRGWFKKKG